MVHSTEFRSNPVSVKIRGVGGQMSEESGSGAAPRVSRKDRLVRWSRAARVLGVSDETLTSWHEAGYVPAVRTPLGRGWLFTYQSWLDAVLGATRPGKPADVAEIGRQWFRDHVPAEQAVA
jgi:hypothetical protein